MENNKLKTKEELQELAKKRFNELRELTKNKLANKSPELKEETEKKENLNNTLLS